MNNLEPISDEVISFYDRLYSGMTKKKEIADAEYLYTDLYKNIKNIIVEAEREYKNSCQALYTLLPSNTIDLCVGKQEMTYLYDNKFVKSNGRDIYNQIMSLPQFNLCPFCKVSPVINLDHYLPISVFCRFGVIPTNLVPICFQCNNEKKEYYGKTNSNSIVNPYFDQFINISQWLYCDIEFKYGGIVANFVVGDRSSIFTTEQINKIRFTFDKMKIGEKYLAFASSRFTVYYDEWESQYHTNKDSLIIDLSRERDLYAKKGQINSWEHAMYHGLVDYYSSLNTL